MSCADGTYEITGEEHEDADESLGEERDERLEDLEESELYDSKPGIEDLGIRATGISIIVV